MKCKRPRLYWTAIGLNFTAVLILCLLMVPGGSEAVKAASQATDPFFELSISLEPGQMVRPTYTQVDGSRTINFSVTLSDGSPIDLLVTDGNGAASWSGSVQEGETLWGTTTLTAGSNEFSLQNVGEAAVEIEFNLYDTADVPYAWIGKSLASGLNSTAQLNFPQSGLYTFDFDVTDGGQYEFLLDENYIQKTVVVSTSVAYYVEAGLHDVQIVQDNAGNVIDWQVEIRYSGVVSDELPYHKSSAAITEEWLPIFVDSSVPVNLVISTTNAVSTTLDVEVTDGAGALIDGSARVVRGGETLWSSFNLVQGVNLIHLTAQNGRIDYDLTVHTIAAAPYTWRGQAAVLGEASHARVAFPTDGLYTFDLRRNRGRYQFQVNESFLKKIVESNTSVTYYIPAGVHDLSILPDAEAGANWSVGISAAGGEADSLPYTKSGGNIGGAGNDFSEEWLPIALITDTQVNLSLQSTGAISDGVRLEVYRPGASNPAVSYQILGSEKAWISVQLAAGINRLHLVTTGNGEAIAYDLALEEMPDDGEAAWDGVALGKGHDSTVMINFPTAGIYSFALQSEQGFANLLLDDVSVPAIQGAQPPALNARQDGSTEAVYERMVTAGTHRITVVQDPAFPVTAWSAMVAQVEDGEDSTFLAFAGTLGAGTSINQIYGALAEPLAFNFSITAEDGDVALDLLDSAGAILWAETILAGETVWGTGTFTTVNQIRLTEKVSATTNVDLTFNYLPGVDYEWSGDAMAAGVDSHIRMDFPAGGLHTFFLGEGSSGRYQFRVNDEFIQKTVEDETSVTYYVPAGTHDLYIQPDSGVGASWSVAIGAAGADVGTLPYVKRGGAIGGAGNDFSAEWLPIHLGADTRANIVITSTGRMSDSLRLQVWDRTKAIMTADPILGTETLWTMAELPEDARLYLVAAAGNSAAINYEIAIHPIPESPYSWTGRSLAGGLNPEIELIAPVNGTYRVAVTILEGFINFGQITPVATANQRQVADNIAFSIPLSAGAYRITGQQSQDIPVNRWEVAISLTEAAELSVDAVVPNRAVVNTTETVVITGLNFIEPNVYLVDGNKSYTASVTSITSEAITVTIPETVPVGTHDLLLVDSDGRRLTLPDAFTVEPRLLWLPKVDN